MPGVQKVLCIGGANVDFKIKRSGGGEYVLGDSNPIRSVSSWGGVARNIAENLAYLDIATALISRVGQDALGEALLADLKRAGIGYSGVSRSSSSCTGTYTALLGAEGELWTALADMGIYEELTPEVLLARISEVQEASLVILDTNLSQESLEFLALQRSSANSLWAVPTSQAKVGRLTEILSRLDGIILNRDELNTLTGKRISSFNDLQEASLSLRSAGVGAVIVTQGAGGVYFSSAQYSTLIDVKAIPAGRDVTGAGDAFAAGFFSGVYLGCGPSESVYRGIAAAQLALQTDRSVSTQLSSRTLAQRVGELSRAKEEEAQLC